VKWYRGHKDEAMCVTKVLLLLLLLLLAVLFKGIGCAPTSTPCGNWLVSSTSTILHEHSEGGSGWARGGAAGGGAPAAAGMLREQRLRFRTIPAGGTVRGPGSTRCSCSRTLLVP
jgi:hypothetical protein